MKGRLDPWCKSKCLGYPFRVCYDSQMVVYKGMQVRVIAPSQNLIFSWDVAVTPVETQRTVPTHSPLKASSVFYLGSANTCMDLF